jgi:outer membrane protein TolC
LDRQLLERLDDWQNANALATTEDIVLAADQVFFNALQVQALLKVADQNVSTRQTTETQVSEMTKNKLKSIFDQSFADVNLSQAKLLLHQLMQTVSQDHFEQAYRRPII